MAGQPLGYHSSWPLFALSHHILVWWAAEQVLPGFAFDGYAVLGDDVVIADTSVAAMYEKGLKKLGFQLVIKSPSFLNLDRPSLRSGSGYVLLLRIFLLCQSETS